MATQLGGRDYRTTDTGSGRSIGDLFSDLGREISSLFRQEITLAKAEMSQKVGLIGKEVALIAVGAVLALLGLMTLDITLVIALVHAGLAWWSSTLIVGLVMLAIGGGLAWSAINGLKKGDYVPRKTIDSLKEDEQWVKQQMS